MFLPFMNVAFIKSRENVFLCWTILKLSCLTDGRKWLKLQSTIPTNIICFLVKSLTPSGLTKKGIQRNLMQLLLDISYQKKSETRFHFPNAIQQKYSREKKILNRIVKMKCVVNRRTRKFSSLFSNLRARESLKHALRLLPVQA